MTIQGHVLAPFGVEVDVERMARRGSARGHRVPRERVGYRTPGTMGGRGRLVQRRLCCVRAPSGTDPITVWRAESLISIQGDCAISVCPLMLWRPQGALNARAATIHPTTRRL